MTTARNNHKCSPHTPICARCESEHLSPDEMLLRSRDLRQLFFENGHDYDNPDDPAHLL